MDLLATPSHPTTLEEIRKSRKPLRNVNSEHSDSLSRLDRTALWITNHVGTMGFFLFILSWTVLWCGYNILASEITGLHWKSFDPFPAFVAYLLISNVIQILLMPLIMVGQNLQGRHAELRAQSDFEINTKAELEIETILQHLECQQRVLLTMVQAQGVKLDDALDAALRSTTSAATATANAARAAVETVRRT